MTPIRTPAELGALVRTERRAQGLRQDELALAAGTGRRFVSELENGKATARLEDVLSVVAALGLTVDVRRPDGDARA
ncbi:MAG TPA: type II toxin-antitoxin system Y4mF family antitoxin [Solirubrobacteraceae bacterium]|jgi:y4mF family transcriptional regulator|nr:type II toxin-antitoxin system Y4mF family antitoxin [Solirubrobacteraceae bacterium]